MSGPRDAAVTVIGGGAIGAAVAFFMAREGWKDVQLLDGGELCGATSSQAAGFVGQARPTVDRARLAMASAELYRTFERETGYSTDWREVGALRIALSETAKAELEAIADTAAVTGLPVEFLSPSQVRSVYPAIQRVEDVVAALWSPTDGYLQPNSLVNAYVRAARDLGVTFSSRAPVTDIEVVDGAVAAVHTPHGRHSTELVVDAAGPWAGAVARMVGLELPVVPVLHEYFVTGLAPGWDGSLPCLRIPEIQVYARGEMGHLLCGGFEHQALSLDPRTVKVGDELSVAPQWDTLAGFAAGLDRFAPGAADLGVSTVFKGWPGFTPDGRFLVGPVRGVRGFVMAAGCNAHGVSGSAGIAMHVVESLQPDQSDYVRSLSPNRYVPRTWDWSDARRSAQAVYENYYPMPVAVPTPTAADGRA